MSLQSTEKYPKLGLEYEVCPKFNTEDLRTLIELCLNRFTTEQKQMVADGTVDLSIQTILAEMCLSIVELVTAVTMEATSPLVAYWTARHSPTEINAYLRNDRPRFFGIEKEDLFSNLHSSFHQSLAEAVQVNADINCESLEKLIKLFGIEAMEEIKIFIAVGKDFSSLSDLSSDFGTKCLPLFISLDGMVTHAARVLQYMFQLKSQQTAQGTNKVQSAVSLGMAPGSRAGLAVLEDAVVQSSSSLCADAALSDNEQKNHNEGEMLQPGTSLPADSAISEKVQKIPEKGQRCDQTNTKDLTDQKPVLLVCGDAAVSLPCPTELLASLHEDSFTGMSGVSLTTCYTKSNNTFKSATYYKCLVSLLLVKLLTHITEDTQIPLTLKDMTDIIENLADSMVKEHFGTDTFLTPNDETVENTHKILFRELLKQFGSTKALQAAMVSRDPAFHNAVLQALKHHLIVSSSIRPNHGVVLRFFISTYRDIAKPLKACCRTKIHPESCDQDKDVISQTPIEKIYISPEKENTEAPQPSPEEPIVSTASMSERYKANENLLSLLLAELLTHTAKKARTSLLLVDFQRILKHLTDKALEDINFADSIINSDIRGIKKTPKALFRDLRQQFGSAEVLLEGMLSHEPAVDSAFIKALKTHLTVFSLTQNKNTSTRFFSSVARAIVKPFTVCCGGSSDAD